MDEGRLQASDLHAHDWPLRPWLLAALLGLAGLLIHFAIRAHTDDPLRMALAAFLFFGPLSAALSLERARWKEVAIFAGAAGLVMAGLAWRAVGIGDHAPDAAYGFGAGVIATLLALPLFQAGFHRLRCDTPYRDAHFFVWTDAVSAAGAFAFVGLTWALLFVLAALFRLIKIELLHDLLEYGWFGWMVSGIAFGAALGLLRNSLKILGTLQSVVLLLLSVLAVPLALALAIFLLASVLSGPNVLWEATNSATPVLLACAIGCFVLTNAIVRDDDTDMTRSPVMRIAAFVLGIGILPLTVFAAVSMGMRVAQYGLAPERLWGLVAIAFACAYGVAIWGAAIRGRVHGWRPFLRRANLNLAVGGSVLALVLALPIFDFGALSAANQLSRLKSGEVSAKSFDYDALKWDFGDAGRRALARLAKDPDKQIAALAAAAQARTERSWAWTEKPEQKDQRLAHIAYAFEDTALRSAVEDYVRRDGNICKDACTALDLGAWPDGAPHLAVVEGQQVSHLRRTGDGSLAPEYLWGLNAPTSGDGTTQAQGHVPRVEVRPFAGRRIYVDGKPINQPFE